MRVIALVGMSGTGKTTLMNELTMMLPGKVECLQESTRGEVFSYCNLPLMDLQKAEHRQLVKYDIGRIELQLKREQECISRSNKEILIIDKAAPFLLMYALTLSSRFIPESCIDVLTTDVIVHSHKYYNNLIHLPVSSWCQTKDDGLNRTLSNNYMLQALDGALEKVIDWLVPLPIVKLNSPFERADFLINQLKLTKAKIC